MPSSTYTFEIEKSAPGFKASKDRVTLLVWGNANGNKKLRPMLLYQNENSHALRDASNSSLPLTGKSQRNARITLQIWRHWFVDYFVPEMTEYLDENSVAFKVLFILDSASAHSLDYVFKCPNINVVFFTFSNLSYETSGPKYH